MKEYLLHVIISSLCDTEDGYTIEFYPSLVAFMTGGYNLQPLSAILTRFFFYIVEVLWSYSLIFLVI